MKSDSKCARSFASFRERSTRQLHAAVRRPVQVEPTCVDFVNDETGKGGKVNWEDDNMNIGLPVSCPKACPGVVADSPLLDEFDGHACRLDRSSSSMATMMTLQGTATFRLSMN